MAILRPYYKPTVTSEVTLRRQQPTIASPDLYAPQQRPTPEFEQPPITGDVLKEQMEKLRVRTPPPQLQPGARVKSVGDLVQPSFQTFYERLNAIRSYGEEATLAEQARNAYRQMQALQSIGNIAVSPRGGGYSGGGGGRVYGVPSSPRENFKYAQNIAGRYGWNNSQELGAWYQLGMKESGWRNTAQNPTSSAYGIGQFLDKTWSTVGGRKTSDAATQVEYMARYIKQRYGSPSRALAAWHSRSPHWY